MWPFKREKWEKHGASWTSEAIEQQFERKLSLPTKPYYDLRDPSYRAISHKEFEKIMFDCWFPKDFGEYAKGRRDCDKFTVQCMAKIHARWAELSRGDEAMAFGYIAAKAIEMIVNHAFIWHMDDTGDIAYYEPQTGQRWYPTITKAYAIEA